MQDDRRTLIFYEAPHRLIDALLDLRAVCGDRAICVARELTKVHEEIWRGSISAALDHFHDEVLGEIVLVVAGAPEAARWPEERVRAALQAELDRGVSANEAAKRIAPQAGWTKREAYELIHTA